MRAKKDIYDKQSMRILVAKGTEVSDNVINKLVNIGKYNPEDFSSEDTYSENMVNEDMVNIEGTINKASSVLTRDFIKKTTIINVQKLELPSRILNNIIFESKDEPWWVYINALGGYLDWIYTHSINVSIMSMMMAAELKYDAKELENVGLGAFLHDVGKLIIPKSIISKPSSLTDIEMEHVRQHCELGASSLEPFSLPKECMDIVLQHHERLDGSGYPKGLKGDEISRNAKIVMIADVFDAITSGRPYRGPLKTNDALKIITDDEEKYSKESIGLLENILK